MDTNGRESRGRRIRFYLTAEGTERGKSPQSKVKSPRNMEATSKPRRKEGEEDEEADEEEDKVESEEHEGVKSRVQSPKSA
jgi:hypothetical protein